MPHQKSEAEEEIEYIEEKKDEKANMAFTALIRLIYCSLLLLMLAISELFGLKSATKNY